MNIIAITLVCSSFIYSIDTTNAVGGLRTKLPDGLINADKQTRISAGWYDYVSTAPKAQTNESVLCTGFKRLGEDFTGEYIVNHTDQEANRYSVRSIIREIRLIGKYDQFRSFLESAKLDWDFVGSNYLADDDSDFIAMRTALVQQGVVTEEELTELLSKCIWHE